MSKDKGHGCDVVDGWRFAHRIGIFQSNANQNQLRHPQSARPVRQPASQLPGADELAEIVDNCRSDSSSNSATTLSLASIGVSIDLSDYRRVVARYGARGSAEFTFAHAGGDGTSMIFEEKERTGTDPKSLASRAFFVPSQNCL